MNRLSDFHEMIHSHTQLTNLWECIFEFPVPMGRDLTIFISIHLHTEVDYSL